MRRTGSSVESAAEWAQQQEAASLSAAEAEKRQKAARAIYGEPFEKQVISRAFFDAEMALCHFPVPLRLQSRFFGASVVVFLTHCTGWAGCSGAEAFAVWSQARLGGAPCDREERRRLPAGTSGDAAHPRLPRHLPGPHLESAEKSRVSSSGMAALATYVAAADVMRRTALPTSPHPARSRVSLHCKTARTTLWHA